MEIAPVKSNKWVKVLHWPKFDTLDPFAYSIIFTCKALLKTISASSPNTKREAKGYDIHGKIYSSQIYMAS